MIVELPWPPKELSPNARLHWRALARHKTAYKERCMVKLDSQCAPKITHDGRIPLVITISPPDRRRRDNLQHSLKYALDRLAVRLLVDDYRFDPSYVFAEPVKGGRVTVEVVA